MVKKKEPKNIRSQADEVEDLDDYLVDFSQEVEVDAIKESVMTMKASLIGTIGSFEAVDVNAKMNLVTSTFKHLLENIHL